MATVILRSNNYSAEAEIVFFGNDNVRVLLADVMDDFVVKRYGRDEAIHLLLQAGYKIVASSSGGLSDDTVNTEIIFRKD